ncbi:MAG: hypothetical protein KKE11_05175 [Gammaproteobacteria bacterium]|nr:hypothetical protein [Gammaproteobacteria bacterium]
MHQFIRVHLNKNEIELVMAVPLHITKLRQRGFNQSEIIARILSEQLNLKYSGHNLCRKKRTKSQVDLARAERLKNVSGAFTLRDPDQTRQKSVLLIDDIFTTGATLNECAYVLKRDGLASKVTVLTIAR